MSNEKQISLKKYLVISDDEWKKSKIQKMRCTEFGKK